MKHFAFSKIFNLTLLFFIFFVTSLFSLPINNQYDPVPFHTVFGTNKFYTKRERFNFSINLSPFYQYSCGARSSVDATGGTSSKVPEGDMLGRWNMLGLFYKPEGSPASKKFNTVRCNARQMPDADTQTRYGTLSNAWYVLDNSDQVPPSVIAPPDNPNNLDKNYTTSFDPANKNDGFFSVPIDYEKMGLRGQLNFDFTCGLGVNVKGGIVDYRQEPTFNDQTGPTLPITEAQITEAQTYIKNYLMAVDKRNAIFKELGIDAGRVNKTVFEDTHIAFYWNPPFRIKNKEEEHVATFAPYLSLGMWLPTGMKKDISQAFSIPTGNDGFTGFTADVNLNLDFPGTIQWALGGGIVLYTDSKTYDQYFVPTHEYQSGVYPWKTSITKKPGLLWYFNASFKAEDFIDDLGFYFDWIYTRHRKDSISINDTDPNHKDVFWPSMLEENSVWYTLVMNCGLNYKIAPAIEVGVAFQAPLGGKRVYRDITLMGTLTFNF